MNFDKLIKQVLLENDYDPTKFFYAKYRTPGNVSGAAMAQLIDHVQQYDNIQAGRGLDPAGRKPDQIPPIPDDIRQKAEEYLNAPEYQQHLDYMKGLDSQIKRGEQAARQGYRRRRGADYN
jgi:hypothetical protein